MSLKFDFARGKIAKYIANVVAMNQIIEKKGSNYVTNGVRYLYKSNSKIDHILLEEHINEPEKTFITSGEHYMHNSNLSTDHKLFEEHIDEPEKTYDLITLSHFISGLIMLNPLEFNKKCFHFHNGNRYHTNWYQYIDLHKKFYYPCENYNETNILAKIKNQLNFIKRLSDLILTKNAKIITNNSIINYIKFLQLIKSNHTTMVSPFDVDIIWHAHMLSHESYVEDTKIISGKILNHDDSPHEGMNILYEKTKELLNSTHLTEINKNYVSNIKTSNNIHSQISNLQNQEITNSTPTKLNKTSNSTPIKNEQPSGTINSIETIATVGILSSAGILSNSKILTDTKKENTSSGIDDTEIILTSLNINNLINGHHLDNSLNIENIMNTQVYDNVQNHETLYEKNEQINKNKGNSNEIKDSGCSVKLCFSSCSTTSTTCTSCSSCSSCGGGCGG